MTVQKQRPQFEGVSVFDSQEEYITGAVAKREGMDLVVFAHLPADPDLQVNQTCFIRATSPEIVLQGTFQKEDGLTYHFTRVRLSEAREPCG